jgi:glutamate-1-semialdehyde 2,1-aminomutase
MFLMWVEKPATKSLYASPDRWIAHANEGLPVQLANLTSVWTILFTQSGRYNWMLQYYLRAQGRQRGVDGHRPTAGVDQLHGRGPR